MQRLPPPAAAFSEQIQSQYNVLIAGPTTITALLNSLSIGFKAVTVNEKAKEVRELLAAAKHNMENSATCLKKRAKRLMRPGARLGMRKTAAA